MSKLFKTKKQKAVWIIWIIVVICIVGQRPSYIDNQFNNIPLNPILVAVQAITSFVIAIVVAALFVKHND